MSERFSRLFELEKPLYAEGAPLVVRACALLRDNDSGSLIGQLKLYSMHDKVIKTVKVRLACYDSMGRDLGCSVEYEYLDLQATSRTYFGVQTPIFIPNERTRSFSVTVCEVGFSDNSVWNGSASVWKPITVTAIMSVMALKAYREKYGANASYVATEQGDLWVCTCGEFNRRTVDRCRACGASFAELKSIDVDQLLYEKAIALSKNSDRASLTEAISIFEEIKEYRDAAAQSEALRNELQAADRQKAKKKKKIAIVSALSVFMAGVIAIFGYFVIYPQILLANGDYVAYVRHLGVEEFEIPDGVTSIDAEEFLECDTLKSITVPDSVTSIGYNAFYGCSSLSSVTFDENSQLTSIGNYAFEDCTSLTSVTFGENSKLTSIGAGAFEGCASLSSITIPSSVTSIDKYAFRDCSSLSSVTFGENSKLTSIGEEAFVDCSSLTSITIPSSVTSIGIYAFYGCSRLSSITIPFVGATKDGTSYTNFGYIFGARSYSYQDDYVPTSLKTVVITGGTSIGEGAFYNCYSLTSITIPSSVTSIGDWAFSGCTSLSSITIPSSVTSIGDWAFSGCTSLSSITIPSSVTSIGEWAFSSCDSLSSITIPSSVTSIGEEAFFGCYSLSSVTFGENSKLTSIGAWAFSDCTSLSSITIPSSMTSIGEYAFYDCYSLSSVTFEDTEGWKAGSTALSSTSLASTSTAATYLTWTYEYDTWTKE